MTNKFPTKVKLVEVGPRDGLQNESKFVPTDIKIDFINQLSQTGLPMIEATSFVSEKWVPQMSDHSTVMQQIIRHPKVIYSALVPNVQGFENAALSKVGCVAVFTTTSETFAKKNTHCNLKDSVNRALEIIQLAKHKNIPTRAYISCAWHCPYEGKTYDTTLQNITHSLASAGADEIIISDTIGKATAAEVHARLKALNQNIPTHKLGVHFHDTYGQGVANIYASLELGISIIDASVSGLGGCPYAPGAGGNVATEDVLYLLDEMNIATGVNMQKLIQAGEFINQYLQRTNGSKVAKALRALK